jgi:uncharacterized membrane protein (UPF0127 family)
MGTNQRHRKQNIHQAIGVLVLVTALFFGVKWWLNYVARGRTMSVTFVAENPGQHARGLMFRKTIGQHEGMIFLFPEENVQSFWMKDTYISLDMIFIDSAYKVVGILHDVPILNETPRKIDKPSRYVIELKGGATKHDNINEGASVKGIE